MSTQCDRIIDYITRNGSITALEAMESLGVMRLASRINDLKRNGFSIASETVKSKNRFGDTVYFAKYTMKEEQDYAQQGNTDGQAYGKAGA